jgi:hypothetical protein
VRFGDNPTLFKGYWLNCAVDSAPLMPVEGSLKPGSSVAVPIKAAGGTNYLLLLKTSQLVRRVISE